MSPFATVLRNMSVCTNPEGWGPLSNIRFADFTPCFEELLSVVIPCGQLFLYIYPIYRSHQDIKRRQVVWSKLLIIKLLIIGVLIILSLLKFSIVWSAINTINHYQVIPPLVDLIKYIVSLFYAKTEHHKSHHTSNFMLLFWFFQIILNGIRIRTEIMLDNKTLNPIVFPIVCINALIHIVAFAVEFTPKLEEYELLSSEEEQQGNFCPEAYANVFSRISFWWMNSLMKLGYEKPLTLNDVWVMERRNQARDISDRFEKNWEQELKKKNPSLILALAKSFGLPFFLGGFFKILHDIMNFVQPMLLKQLLAFITSYEDPNSTVSVQEGYSIAVLMFLAAITQTCCLQQYFQACFISGVRVRAAIITTVYRKALNLSTGGKENTTIGEIVNHMSVDASRIEGTVSFLHNLWSAPFQIVLSLWLLYGIVGPAVFSGIGIMILMVPINAMFARMQKKIQVRQMNRKDERIKLMDEILSGIKVIKLYAWEKLFKEKVENIREEELECMRKSGFILAGQSLATTLTPFLVSFATFALFSFFSGQPLTAEIAFVALALLNLLQFPLMAFPFIIVSAVEASVSVNRIFKFLMREELDKDAVIRIDHPDPIPNGETLISVRHLTAKWDVEKDAVLEDLTFDAKCGSLFTVVGPVGSGKSSLMSALLGELHKTNGTVMITGSVAYIPQQAWIMNATLRENILFGKPYDSVLYRETVEACALVSDFKMLVNGDMTSIGERGITLSGGQKARVQLARAVYAQTDIYLLDDPLSAVDAHVGKHIFEKVIGPKGLLQNKARIFITHGLTYLSQCDNIMVLKYGKCTQMGSFEALLSVEGDFQRLVQEFSHEQDASEAEPPENDYEESVEASVKPQVPASGPTPSDQEESKVGKVSWSVYLHFAKAFSPLASVLGIIAWSIFQFGQVGVNVWLKHWSDMSSQGDNNVTFYLMVYGLIGIGYTSMSAVQAIIVRSYGSVKSARTMHKKMLTGVLRSPMSFFDVTPLGRVLNRFTKDLSTIDDNIPSAFQQFFRVFFSVSSTLLVIIYTTPIFSIVLIPLGFIYIFIQRYYLSSSRELKRLDSTSRSPMYAHFSETLNGVSSIRAYGHAPRFCNQNEEKLDANLRAVFPSICCNRWLGIRLEFIGAIITFGAALFSVQAVSSGGLDAGLVGLAVSYALSVTQALNWLVRMSCDIETNIISVERVVEYSENEPEAPDHIESLLLPAGWPGQGAIQYKNYETRYRPGLELVLKGVTFNIKEGEKIGIVGRTGAGKSSLTLSLFRLIEATGGDIIVDGVNISTMGLHDLRSRLTIIPQDPILFSGSVRENLDPFNHYADHAIWAALESSNMKEYVSRQEGGLFHTVMANGRNFSVGQRQLLCLARALLRRSRIIVLDEATAACDVETDNIIQRTIRRVFADCTILTIAHRINTVMDCDRILVLEKGLVAEFDSPLTLLENPSSMFYRLASNAGVVSSSK